MPFQLSETINKYVAARGKIFLNACPGSGKTTTVAYKLSRLTSEWDKQSGNYSGIACLSFTNIAKDEIRQKYAEFSNTPLNFPHLVSTIDSFINQYITLPFFYLFEPNIQRPRIVEDSNIINSAWEIHYNNQKKPLQNQLKNKRNQPLHYSYPPFDIHIELNGTFTHAGKVCNPEKVDPDIFKLYCKEVKKWQIRQKGLLAIHDSAYIAAKILSDSPRIAMWLANRFPVIIIDEAQDTSEIQFDILEKIAPWLSSLELIGDPFQCLYEWRNASPEMLVERTQNTDWTVIPLNDNRRSQSKIIHCFSQLRKKDDAEVKPASPFDVEDPILVVTYSKNCEHHAIAKFLPRIRDFSDNHVVVRGRSLRDKLLGYKRPSTGKPLWNSSLPEVLIRSKKSFDSHHIKQGVGQLRAQLPEIIEPTGDIIQKRKMIDELKEDYLVNALLFEIVRNLPSLELSVSKWSEETQNYLYQALNQQFSVKNKIDFQLKSGQYRRFYDQPVEEIYGERVITEIPVSTIHQVKGMTFDTLLLIMSPDSKGANISVKDVFQSDTFPSEKQRMIYVAMSRPRYLLAVGVPNETPEETLFQKFGEDVVII